MLSYNAIIIHSSVSGGRCSGTFYLDNFALHFQGQDIKHDILLENLSITAGGAGNRFVFFRDRTRPEVSVYTSEKSVLKNPVLVANPNLSADLNSSKRTLNKTLAAGVLSLLFIAAFFAGIYLVKDRLVEKLAEQIPKSWEQKAGDKLFTALSLQYHFVENDSLKKQFLQAARPLFKQIEKQGYKIDLYFAKDPTINAFALPGGKVVVQTGLIENAESWEEVMGVLAHELAHVTRRHHARGVINNIGIYAILGAVLGDISALAATFASFGGDLASLSNSRTFEREADETGWEYLVKAEINPSGLISFFKTIKKSRTPLDSAINNSVDISFLSTHPNTDERIKNLQEKQKGIDKNFFPMPNNFKEFKAKMSKAK